MKKKLWMLVVILGIVGVLAIKIFDLSIEAPAKGKGRLIYEEKMTWGEFLDFYIKENPIVTDFNPEPNISKGIEVQVVKIEYPNGLMSLNGFYNYAIVTRVFDAKTGKDFFSEGKYRNKK